MEEGSDGKNHPLMEHIRQLQKSTLEYSRKSFGLLVETDQIAADTAKNISHQREQLENTAKCLEEAGNSVTESQKYLNGIKGVFSSVSEWWSTNSSAVTDEKAPLTAKTSQPANIGISHPSSSTLPDRGTGPSTELPSEIDGQNKTIDRLQTKADSLDSRMASQIERMNKLLK